MTSPGSKDRQRDRAASPGDGAESCSPATRETDQNLLRPKLNKGWGNENAPRQLENGAVERSETEPRIHYWTLTAFRFGLRPRFHAFGKGAVCWRLSAKARTTSRAVSPGLSQRRLTGPRPETNARVFSIRRWLDRHAREAQALEYALVLAKVDRAHGVERHRGALLREFAYSHARIELRELPDMQLGGRHISG